MAEQNLTSLRFIDERLAKAEARTPGLVRALDDAAKDALQMAEERCETWKQQCQRDQDELRSLKAQIAEQAKRCREAVNVMRASAEGATQEHTRKRAEAIRDVYAAQADALEKMLQP